MSAVLLKQQKPGEHGQSKDQIQETFSFVSDSSRFDCPKTLDQTGPIVEGLGARMHQHSNYETISLATLTPAQQSAIQQAKKFAMEQSIKMVMMKQNMVQQSQHARSMQRHQAVVLMCRIYIGSIHFEIREDTVRQIFSPFGPIRSISMSWDALNMKHKGFAFMEFEMPEAASLAMEHMNGYLVHNRNLKIGRPSNMPQAQAMIEELFRESHNYSRVYVSNIHPELSLDDIKSVFEAFGPIKNCELAVNPLMPSQQHKGYGIMEFETREAAQDAISSMHMFDLGGQLLRVGRAVTPPDACNLKTNSFNALAGINSGFGSGQSSAGFAAPPTVSATSVPTSTSQSSTALPEASAFAAAQISAKLTAMDEAESQGGKTQVSVTSSNTDEKPRAGSRFGGFAGNAPPPVVIPPVVTTLPPISVAPVPPPNNGTTSDTASLSLNEKSTSASSSKESSSLSAEDEEQLRKKAILAKVDGIGSIGGGSVAMSKVGKGGGDVDSAALDVSAEEMSSLHRQEELSIKGSSARQLVMQKLMRSSGVDSNESVVIKLRNMVTVDEIDDDLQEEIEDECSKYGEVVKVIVYQERFTSDEDSPIEVKIFVEFATNAYANSAKQALNGRFFGGRKVECSIYEQDLYNDNDLSG